MIEEPQPTQKALAKKLLWVSLLNYLSALSITTAVTVLKNGVAGSHSKMDLGLRDQNTMEVSGGA